ncbi:hypothetical protein EMIHUDRAFT_221122 [Emiliania huxleyi CCMP1516]|uniref:BTB domain-containing protein n=2 Tax=Emiliania huxleyi TaxID=2903 RepID=A0A0D3HZB1_EMIH1|nr:hypothetical protein EMIHUDRAFT_221122 [Emiliania huxleyi CCMP1516]EOD04346.1 hypothetical protein EMIHUDRAFT_221122 [Emiliania huxleyi CCMP1516]|eukprot:XP_005756775.1 hypothetical protein EMIHUDRAFT_221122 [Emiliania huxleyi CCMP1516]
MPKRAHDAVDDDQVAAVELSDGEPQPERQIALWRASTFCDATVVVEGRSFAAHRLVLASSDFMSTCLQSSMTEQTGRVELHDISASSFELVLEYLYTGKARVAVRSLVELLEAAAMLQVQPLVAELAKVLGAGLAGDNCLDLWATAARLGLPAVKPLKAACLKFACESFADVVSTTSFLSLSCPQLECLIRGRRVHASEETVFAAVIKWARAAQPSPGELSAILQHIHFRDMRPSFVSSEVLTEPLVAEHMQLVAKRLLSDQPQRRIHLEATGRVASLAYTWKVPSFSVSGDSEGRVYSPIFRSGGDEWQLKLSKGGEVEGYLGIFLICPNAVGDVTVKADFTLKLHNQTPRKSVQKWAEHEFKHTAKPHMGWINEDWGWQKFIELEKLSAGFLVDDTLTVEVSIERRNE